jgi:hypothetical protein
VARKVAVSDMTAEERAEHAFKTAEVRYNEQWDVVNSLRDTDAAMKKALAEIDKRMTLMFRSFDNWQYVISNNFTAREDEVRQTLIDALVANADVLPDTEDMTGLERYRYCASKAAELVSALKGWGVKVRPLEIETPPLCASCHEELST